MGLLDRLSKPAAATAETVDKTAAKATKAARGGVQRGPKIRLRPEEMKQANTLNSKEKLAGYLIAAIEAAVVVFVARKGPGGINKDDQLSIPLMFMMLTLFAVCVKFTNRTGATLASTGAVVMWIARFPLDMVFAYGLMGYMLFLSLSSMKARQKIMAQRAAQGDYTDGIAEAKAAKANPKPDYAATDAAGRALAAKSNRYTPPKAKKK
jgi:hypothetical protein